MTPSATNPASQWRIELARELAPIYGAREGVKMVVLGGSPSRGLADAYSDLDVVVYWDDVDIAWLESIPLAEKGGQLHFVRRMGPEDAYLESYQFGPLKVDLGHSTLSLWESWTEAVLVQHEIAPPLQKSIAGFLDAVPLYGQDLYESWREKLATYPEPLAEKMVKAHLGFFHRGVLNHQGLDRGDLLFVVDGTCQMLKKGLAILAGLNRVYFSAQEPRWIEHELSRWTIKPDRAWERIVEILNADRRDIEGLLESFLTDVLDLTQRNMPHLDLSRLREGMTHQLRPCEEKPSIPLESQ